MSSDHLFRGFTTYHSNDTQYEDCIAYRILCKAMIVVITLAFISLGVDGCSEQPTPYRPATRAVQATSPVMASTTPTATAQLIETPMPSSTPICTNNLTYLEDLSLPDGTVARPGESLDKRWLVENSGTCNWDEHYRLKFISGAELSTQLDQALYPARSGSKATIRILFTTPSEPGTYQSAWQAYDPQGQPFGDPVYIQVIVDTGMP